MESVMGLPLIGLGPVGHETAKHAVGIPLAVFCPFSLRRTRFVVERSQLMFEDLSGLTIDK